MLMPSPRCYDEEVAGLSSEALIVNDRITLSLEDVINSAIHCRYTLVCTPDRMSWLQQGMVGNTSPASEVGDDLRLGLARQEPRGNFTRRHEMLAFQVLIQLG